MIVQTWRELWKFFFENLFFRCIKLYTNKNIFLKREEQLETNQLQVEIALSLNS